MARKFIVPATLLAAPLLLGAASVGAPAAPVPDLGQSAVATETVATPLIQPFDIDASRRMAVPRLWWPRAGLARPRHPVKNPLISGRDPLRRVLQRPDED